MGSIRAALLDAVVAALPLALVYFAGWAYLSSYLDAFGIDYTQVNVPLTTVLVYAFTPISNWKVLVFVIAALFVWQGVALTPSCRKLQSRTSVTWSIILLVAFLFLTKWVAADAALRMADFVWRGEKSVTNVVLVKPDSADKGYQKYISCRADEHLRQVIGFSEVMFVLCVNKKWPGNAVLFAIKADGTISYYAARLNHHEE